MVDVHIPQIGESITHVYIAQWFKAVGESVSEGEDLVELDSDKASMPVPSPVSGVVREILATDGDEVAIGALIARVEAGAVSDAAPQSELPQTPEGTDEVRAGPAARQSAHEAGVDLSNVSGTGPRGRVTREDVARSAAGSAADAGPASQARAEPPVATDHAQRTERVPMTPLRRLVEAQQTAAMLTTFNEVDMSQVMAVRKKYQDRFVKRYGIKLGFMSFFVKAAIDALKQYPAVNAEIDGTDLIYKNYWNIGVAVSGPKGLVVPVVRDADRLSFAETELAIAELAKRARDNKLSISDFQDGTFTISNGGIFGSMMSTPILNPPQVGILGMHNILQRPMGVQGEIMLRPMMYLALSYDHRIIDGREAVGFLVRIKECIEDPERLLIEV